MDYSLEPQDLSSKLVDLDLNFLGFNLKVFYSDLRPFFIHLKLLKLASECFGSTLPWRDSDANWF
jgi:hypothetical protein